MADCFGCSIDELMGSLSSFELNMRVVNRMVAKGFTYDQDKIAEAAAQQENARVESFLQRMRSRGN